MNVRICARECLATTVHNDCALGSLRPWSEARSLAESVQVGKECAKRTSERSIL